MNSKISKSILIATTLLISTAFQAQAQLNVVLTPVDNLIPLGIGNISTYQATFTNDFTYDIFLNSSFASVDAPLTIDSALYDNFFLFPSTPLGDPLPQPAIAGNGGTITTNIFTVSTPSSLPVGTYFGLFTFLGGPSTNTNDPENLSELYTANFQIRNVTPNGTVPEPGVALWLLAAGVSVVLGMRRRRNKK